MLEVIKTAIQARLKLAKVFLYLTGFAFLIITARLFITADKTLLFLIWNLFLAYIPLWISSIMKQMQVSEYRTNLLLPMGLVWLVFFPNGPYIFTDYIHLTYGNSDYFILDVMTLTYFALVAFAASVISLMDIAEIMKKRNIKLPITAIVGLICVLTSFGIYLGRDLRFNSWDVIMKPGAIAKETFIRLSHPESDMITLTAAGIIGAMLFMTYVIRKLFLIQK